MKKRVLSGIRASGRLHLGNYLGAVKGMLELQNNSDYETYYMVADAHGITTPYDPKQLEENRREVILDYLAVGIDPEKSVLFVQSAVPEHYELAYYLSSVVTVARMQHLPTFKEKVKQYPDNVNMALLNYPVLMAADILVYKAGYVPVGIDQEPHLEVAREVARKMNSKYRIDFPEPVSYKTDGEYIPSLVGEGKMSKSVEGSYINLTDDLEIINKKIASVPTDIGRGDKLPDSGGVFNLFKFVEIFQGKEIKEMYEKQYLGEGVRYGELKRALAEVIYGELKPIQERRRELENNPGYVEGVILEGSRSARKVASQTIKEVRKKMGLL